MERTIQIIHADNLAGRLDGFERVYLGSEFCQRLLPSIPDLDYAIGLCSERDTGFTLNTPYLTQTGLEQAVASLEFLASKLPGAEVVFNDWGILDRIIDLGLSPVLGRLLHKQKRGPEIMNLEQQYPPALWEEMKKSGLNEESLLFLTGSKVRRAEMDILPQGISTELPSAFEGKFSFSLHYPYAFVATTRLCYQANIPRFRAGDPFWIYPCEKECETISYQLSHRTMPVPLVLNGNTIFVERSIEEAGDLPPEIDRLVFSPTPGGAAPGPEGKMESARR